jgi:hypothetical protein
VRTAASATAVQIVYSSHRVAAARCAGSMSRSPRPRRAVAGLVPVKQNRFITLAVGQNTVNRDLEAKARALAGLKGYTTNLAACPDGTPRNGGPWERGPATSTSSSSNITHSL